MSQAELGAPPLQPPSAPLLRRAAGAGRATRIAVGIVSRLAWLLLVVWAAVSLTFVLSRVVPADPARLAAGLQAGPEQVAQVRHLLGLDQPLLTQYWHYISGVARFDLGKSIQTRQNVSSDLWTFLPATLELVISAFVVYVIVGVSLGVLWAVKPRGSLEQGDRPPGGRRRRHPGVLDRAGAAGVARVQAGLVPDLGDDGLHGRARAAPHRLHHRRRAAGGQPRRLPERPVAHGAAGDRADPEPAGHRHAAHPGIDDHRASGARTSAVPGRAGPARPGSSWSTPCATP